MRPSVPAVPILLALGLLGAVTPLFAENTTKNIKVDNRGFALGREVVYLIQPTEEAKIAILDADGTWLRSVGQEVPGHADTILSPIELLSDTAGNCYVLDQWGPSIIVISPAGTILRRWGERGFETGQMRQPVDFGMDAKGAISVLDLGREAVIRFHTSGGFMGEVDFDPDETADFYWSNALGVSPEGDFAVVADDPESTLIRNIRRYSPNGTQLAQLNLAKIEGMGEITDLAILPNGSLLFADHQPKAGFSYTGGVYLFDRDGQYQGRLFIKDPERGTQYSPVRVKAEGDRLFVLTSTNLVVQVDLEGFVMASWGAGELGH